MREISFNRLTDTEFEAFGFDFLHALGFVNVDWRKGTGLASSPADKGRDIVCQELREDVDGAKHLETWFVDCKHFMKGVPVSELHNLLAWAQAERPAVALFMVSNFLSNPAKEYLDNYRRNNRPPFKIKYWERPTLEKLCRKKMTLLRKFDLTEEPIRSVKAILKAEEEAFDRVWYDRHQMLMGNVQKHFRDRQILATARKAARNVERKYGKKNLGPYRDFEWGMINGKLSALRWVLGEDWDMLDT
jgi:hypothetical protein